MPWLLLLLNLPPPLKGAVSVTVDLLGHLRWSDFRGTTIEVPLRILLLLLLLRRQARPQRPLPSAPQTFGVGPPQRARSLLSLLVARRLQQYRILDNSCKRLLVRKTCSAAWSQHPHHHPFLHQILISRFRQWQLRKRIHWTASCRRLAPWRCLSALSGRCRCLVERRNDTQQARSTNFSPPCLLLLLSHHLPLSSLFFMLCLL